MNEGTIRVHASTATSGIPILQIMRMGGPRILVLGAFVWSMACSSVRDPSGSPNTESVRAAIRALALPDPFLGRAEAELTAHCMARYGFAYPTAEVSGEDYGRSVFGLAGRLTPGFARTHGYGQAIEDATGPSPFDPIATYLAGLSSVDQRRFYAVLAGPEDAYIGVEGLDGRVIEVPTRGCAAVARNALYGSVATFISIARFPPYLFRFGDEIRSDSEFLAAQKRYSSCMRGEGYEVKGTGAAIELARSRFGSIPAHLDERTGVYSRLVTAGERAMAMADVQCQRTSDVYDAWDEAGFRAAEGWIQRHASEILTLGELQEKSVRRARNILAGA